MSDLPFGFSAGDDPEHDKHKKDQGPGASGSSDPFGFGSGDMADLGAMFTKLGQMFSGADSAMASGTPPRAPDISTTSAASIATSVPVPMARPTSASARAGASLMPSPTKATGPCAARSACTASTLPAGSTSARTTSIPSRAAMAAAVRRSSPVIIATVRPWSCNARIAAGVVSLIGSATATTAAARPSSATSSGVRPDSASRAATGARAAASIPSVAMNRAEPIATGPPPASACTP